MCFMVVADILTVTSPIGTNRREKAALNAVQCWWKKTLRVSVGLFVQIKNVTIRKQRRNR